MEKFSTFFYSCRFLLLLAFTMILNLSFGQGNCLLYPENSGERIACELSYRALEYPQGSKESQLIFDKAIEIGPKYAWAYYEKSVPFFKRGMLAEGVSLINKAIELEPKNYLYYRAYWYFYNRNYEKCIRDLEELYDTHQASYVTTPGGELEMRFLLAMAYAFQNHPEDGILRIKNLIETFKDKPHLKGIYDHYCLGLLYFHNAQYILATEEFEKQLLLDDSFVDTYYYLGLLNEKRERNDVAQNFYMLALDKINGLEGGHSANLFTEFNVEKEDIEVKIKG